MNGIIHGASHPPDADLFADPISEGEMMKGIMHYIDRVIQIARPQQSIFMAIDGVAPRAKMNQQRSRRFRAMRDMEESRKEAQKRGEVPQQLGGEGGVFDSNCITPGTEFMRRVSDTIKYMIRKKIKEDPLWKDLKVYFSGHEVPGEGEHKIMQHIRDMKNAPTYLPNTRHCMYGADADLIMLGLVSHEPHFTLLREVVNFNSFNNGPNKNGMKAIVKHTKESEFQLLHLSLLREYLDVEFGGQKGNEASGVEPYNLECVIDDFVFLTFLVGNDFLPHMPSLDIGDGAFDLLFNTYKEQRNGWGKGGYLTYAGNIVSAKRLEAFLKVVGAAENDIFVKREEDEADYLKKKRKWDKRDGKVGQTKTDEELELEEQEKNRRFIEMLEQTGGSAASAKAAAQKPDSPPADKANDDGEDEDDLSKLSVSIKTSATRVAKGPTPLMEKLLDPANPQKDFKGRYYFEKMGLTPIDDVKHVHLRHAYMEGLVWCLAYYYRGCISWGWFYPYHYGPMISDLVGLEAIFETMAFEVGEPFLPFQQLMGCLPPGSAHLVPNPYKNLMTSAASPIADLYPTTFDVDMNGKKNPWEGVNLLPFIDAKRLKEAIAQFCPDKALTRDEKARNEYGSVYLFEYDKLAIGDVPSCNRDIGLKDINVCNSRMTAYTEPERAGVTFRPEIVKGTRIPFPGFPSLGVLPIARTELAKIGVNCFGMESKYPTQVLELRKLPPLPSAEALAAKVLGQTVYVNWPMMHESKVAAISDEFCEVRYSADGELTVKNWTAKEADRWAGESASMIAAYKSGAARPGTGGVDIGELQIRIKVLPLQGMKVNPDGSTKKLFGKTEADVPLHMGLWVAPVEDPRFQERGPMTVADLYPKGTNVILTSGKYKGAIAVVAGASHDDEKGAMVHVRMEEVAPEPPFGLAIVRSIAESYVGVVDAAKILKLPTSVLHKVIGSLSVDPGRFDIGLNMKYKGEFCVVGYTRVKPAEIKDKEAAAAKPTVWGSGDSLLIFGSSSSVKPVDDKRGGGGRGGGGGGGGGGADEVADRLEWELSPKAIRLVSSYMVKYPHMFEELKKRPNERFYDAKTLFPGSGNAEQKLVDCKKWVDQVETAKIPRVVATTAAMGRDAVLALERAAEVRSFALKAQGAGKEKGLKVPVPFVYREASTDDSIVMQSLNTAPELGDRVVNLCARGVPFGLRGTVVAVHNGRGCVDVVMDDEFLGGTSLQGNCSNFKGVLCFWSHLLKVSAKEDDEVLNQFVSKASGKEAVAKLVEQRDQEMAAAASAPAPAAAAPSRQQQGLRDASPGDLRGPSPGGGRGRGAAPVGAKQTGGAWKEAAGPDGKSTGFKGAGRGAVSGLAAAIPLAAVDTSVTAAAKKGGKKAEAKAAPKSDVAASADLKALLGVGVVATFPVPNKGAEDALAAQLKSMLGLNKAASSTAPAAAAVAPPQPAASALLKNLLGVADIAPATVVPAAPAVAAAAAVVVPPPAPAPTPEKKKAKAADALFAMMLQTPASAPSAAPLTTGGFNFTYVREGQTAPSPSQPVEAVSSSQRLEAQRLEAIKLMALGGMIHPQALGGMMSVAPQLFQNSATGSTTERVPRVKKTADETTSLAPSKK